MKRALPGVLAALMLSACAPSRPPAPPSFLPPAPKRPVAANPDPCRPSPLVHRAGDGLDSTGAERAIRAGDADLARCRADRDRYRNAWPNS